MARSSASSKPKFQQGLLKNLFSLGYGMALPTHSEATNMAPKRLSLNHRAVWAPCLLHSVRFGIKVAASLG
ncbi:hypothetical protein VTN96DRAFT_6592 [Rasamsonia emersonii]